MSKRINLHVTKEDIEKGERKCAKRCMLSQALKRQLAVDEHGYVAVRSSGANVTLGDTRYSYKLSNTAVKRLIEFDQGIDVQPFSTVLILAGMKPIAPKASTARKDQINAARQQRNAALRAQGLKPKAYTGERVYGM